jgi:transcriptional regulator with XRE-family HTH domain
MLNKALRLLRLFHEMDQRELAPKLGISRSYISEIESGSKKPTLDLLERYATVFRVPTSTLLLFSEALEAQRFSERLRIRGANKVLRILEWLAAREEDELVSTTVGEALSGPENA